MFEAFRRPLQAKSDWAITIDTFTTGSDDLYTLSKMTRRRADGPRCALARNRYHPLRPLQASAWQYPHHGLVRCALASVANGPIEGVNRDPIESRSSRRPDFDRVKKQKQKRFGKTVPLLIAFRIGLQRAEEMWPCVETEVDVASLSLQSSRCLSIRVARNDGVDADFYHSTGDDTIEDLAKTRHIPGHQLYVISVLVRQMSPSHLSGSFWHAA